MPLRPLVIGLLGLTLAAAAYWLRPIDGPVGSEVSADWDAADWEVFSERAHRALDVGLDTVPFGEAVAGIGRMFVGTAYVPHTLEASGAERLVIDFTALDCVTFVETAFTMARFIRAPEARALLEDRTRAEALYDSLLVTLRYRDGRIEGYPSRLHYFSDWIADAASKGLVGDITEELGGVRDSEPIDFMSTHVDAYRQLSEDPDNVEAMVRVEARLSEQGRFFIPEDALDAAATLIQDGDIIAATSTVPGLDVAHTGLALRVGGTLRLMHAPLVGDSVQISEESLAERVRRISGQDGIIVARPVEGRFVGSRPGGPR